MARPRVFVSSTFYDLRQVRADIERFIIEFGYDPVLHEKGRIPYGSQEKLEEYCYREIELSDIVVCIIGGRYGTPSQDAPYSITQKELKKAIDLGKALFVFVERGVQSEYYTYLSNKESKDIKYHFVDNVAVYRFIEEVEKLPKNNPMTSFDSAQDIVGFLREQWAGLFQRYLQQQARLKEVDVLESMAATAKTLDQLVTFLTEERKNKDQAIHEILLSNHPAFEQLRSKTNTGYRLYFATKGEMEKWLSIAKSYAPVNQQEWDGPDFMEYMKKLNAKKFSLLKVSTRIFDSHGKLKVLTKEDWKPAWITVEERLFPTDEPKELTDDDIPF
jgi:hypothetical protein